MVVRHGTETKTRHCQPLRHRNRHPPRETLNHFYCIELSLLPAERTSKRVFPPSRAHTLFLSLSPGLSLSSSRAFRQVIPSPLVLRPRLPAGYALFPFFPLPSPRLRRPGREIIRTRKRSHPFGCPNGISSLIRGFTAGQTNRPRCRRDNIRRTKEGRFLAELFIRGVSSSRTSVLTKSKRVLWSVKLLRVHLKYLKRFNIPYKIHNTYQVP